MARPRRRRPERHHHAEEQVGHKGAPAADRGALPRLQVGVFKEIPFVLKHVILKLGPTILES